MSKLIILSETNNLDYLRKHGIYPSQFYTDIKVFEKMSSFFNNVKVCCILSGSCSFSRRKLNELLKFMRERIEDTESRSIDSLLIFSDTDVFDSEYYRHSGNLGCVTQMVGKKVIKTCVNPWSGFEYEPCKDTVTYLRDEHKGCVQSALDSFHNHVNVKRTELEDVIQRPKIL